MAKSKYKKNNSLSTQLSLFPQAASQTLVASTQVLTAWQWITSEVSARPTAPVANCLYDCKVWGNPANVKPLDCDPNVLLMMAYLYLTSQFGTSSQLRTLVNTNVASEIVVPIGALDEDVKKLLKTKYRFRNALSEHLAFWVRLATEAKSANGVNFMGSLPNALPEDKGPDGLFMAIDAIPRVEIHSVKNSINNPSAHIASSTFRKSGKAKKGKLLDDFWRKANRNFGMMRLSRLLNDVSAQMNFSPQQEISLALLAKCSYNAVVVADHRYAKPDLFRGYEYVNNQSAKCIATYIGAKDWTKVAEGTRLNVMKIIKAVH